MFVHASGILAYDPSVVPLESLADFSFNFLPFYVLCVFDCFVQYYAAVDVRVCVCVLQSELQKASKSQCSTRNSQRAQKLCPLAIVCVCVCVKLTGPIGNILS